MGYLLVNTLNLKMLMKKKNNVSTLAPRDMRVAYRSALRSFLKSLKRIFLIIWLMAAMYYFVPN